MKFTCTQENLDKGLYTVSHITGKHVSLPILNNVLIQVIESNITLSATNLEIGIKHTIRGKVEETGNFTVQAKLFADYIHLLPKDKVDIELKDQNIKIKSQNTSTTLRGISSEEFPLLPEIKKKDKIVIKASDFKKAIQQVFFAAATDETRPEISGVYFQIEKDKIILAATDSYRLTERNIDINNSSKLSQNIIIPNKTLQELLRIINDSAEKIEIYPTENQILFVYGDVELISRIVEGQYPDYKQIIPTNNKTTITLPTSILTNAIKSASLFCKPGINDIHLGVNPTKGKISITTANTQVGEHNATLEANVVGDENNIVFNYRYLLDGLSAIEGDEVIIELVDNTNPGILRPKDKQPFLYLIMPIKQ